MKRKPTTGLGDGMDALLQRTDGGAHRALLGEEKVSQGQEHPSEVCPHGKKICACDECFEVLDPEVALEHLRADTDKPDPRVLHETEVGSHAEGCEPATWVYMRRACRICGHIECPCCGEGFCDAWPCYLTDHECSYDLPPVTDDKPCCKACGEPYPDESDRSKFDSFGLPLHRCKP